MGQVGSAPEGADLATVCERIGALVEAGEPAKALDLLTTLRSGDATTVRACEQQRLDALAAAAASDASPDAGKARQGDRTIAEQAGKAWTSFSEEYVAPTATAVLPFFVVLVALLVLARLALPLPWARLVRNREQRGTDVRHGVAWALGGSALATLVLPHVPPVPRPAVLFFALAACVVAVHLLSQAWAEALRVRVEVVTGTEQDRAAAGHLAGLLAEMGADRPRGVELPVGTDVEALAGVALSVPPTGGAELTLYRATQVLVPTYPWRVRVDVTGEDVVNVTVKRFRTPVTSVVIDRERLELPPGADLFRVAAAVVLTAVAAQHAASEEGMNLCGARDWRGLGLHAVATCDLGASARDMLPVLARAVDADPDNAPAHVALWYARCRYATDARTLDEYVTWLRHSVDLMRGRDGGWTSLRLRLRLSLAAATLNRMAVGGPDPSASMRTRAEVVTDDLVRELEEHRARPVEHGAAPLAREMWPVAAAMYLAVHEPGDRFWDAAHEALGDDSLLGPTARYAYACYLAGAGSGDADGGAAGGADEERDARDVRAVAQLRLADELPQLARWRERDPALAGLRSRRAYREELGDGQAPGLFRADHGGVPAGYVSITTGPGETPRTGRTK